LFKMQVNSIDEFGLSKYVNRSYLDVDKKINTARRNSYHFIGLQASSSKLGQYIAKNRLQFRYSWYTQISKRAALSAGISLGFINYSFQSSQGGTGGSAFGPDGMLGLHYIRQNTIIGFSVQQIFAPVLVPINQSFQLNRLFNVDVSQRFRVSPQVKLTTYGVVQYAAETSLLYNLGLMSDVSELVMVGVNDFSFRKTSFNVGVKNIRFYGGKIMMVATYSIYHSKFYALNNTLELFLAFQL